MSDPILLPVGKTSSGYWLNTGLYGQPEGHKCPLHHFESPMFGFGWLLRERPIYEFSLVQSHPLTLVDAQGNSWQSDRHYFTDKGSIPAVLHWMIDPDEAVAFYPHDSGYAQHGLYLRPATREEATRYGWQPQTAAESRWLLGGSDRDYEHVAFHRVRLSKHQVDCLLYHGYIAQHGDSFASHSKARKILTGVAVGGVFAWCKGKWQDEKPAAKAEP